MDRTFSSDLIAAVIVTIMLIPQSLGLCAVSWTTCEVGLYASILPLAVYALFGSSSIVWTSGNRLAHDGSCRR